MLGITLTGIAYQLVETLQPATATEKKVDLPIEELKSIIVRDFQDNQYYITGKLSPEVFEDDCVFTDPTTRVQGTQTYAKAVASLFDPKTSRADLIDISVSNLASPCETCKGS